MSLPHEPRGEISETAAAIFGGLLGIALAFIGGRILLTGESVATSSAGRVTRLVGEDALWMGGILLFFGVAILICCVLYWLVSRR